MSTLHDDDIRTITEGGRLDPQADADGDDINGFEFGRHGFSPFPCR